MTAQSEAFIKSLQSSGLLVLVDGIFYFIPQDDLKNKYKFPAAFQAGTAAISPDYFEDKKPPAAAGAAGGDAGVEVFQGLSDRLDSQIYSLDGVTKAVWLNPAEQNAGRFVSKAPRSKQVVFAYSPDKKHILVDSSKGARPSDR